ncbi:MAG TPA: class I SAM-dependent methyltransferase [Solirubrobacter sp.]
MTTEPGRTDRIAAVGYRPDALPHEAVRACNLCGSAHQVEVARTDRYGYPVKLTICATCGLGYLASRLTAEAYAAFYREVYRPLVSAYHGRRIDAETVQAEQRLYAGELAAWLRGAGGLAPRSVLDVGGSTGVVAAAFDGPGVALTVLDPAPQELAVAAAAGMQTIAGFAEDFDAGDQRWDLVLLCQTIDHLLDATATLTALRGLLAPGGRAFVDILDVSWVLSRVGTIEGAYKIDHPYYFTRTTALALFARCGFTVVAERLADDGHWGFLLELGEPRDPEWTALTQGADELLGEIWRRRARR